MAIATVNPATGQLVNSLEALSNSQIESKRHSCEIKPGMVFALQTFWPSKDDWSAARIEEKIVVTETGHEIITRFPAEKLLVSGAHYFTVNGPLETTRAQDPAPNDHVLEMLEAGARTDSLVSGD